VIPRLRPPRTHVALVLAGLLAAPVVGRAAALSLTSQHLTTVATCALLATPPSSAVDTDTYVDQNAPTGTNATKATVNVQSLASKNQRAYIRFDITKCIFDPATTVIVRGAWLELFVNKLAGTCRTEDVFALGSAWTDTTLTWNNQPNPPGTTINNPPSAQRVASAAVGNVSTCANHTLSTYVSFDVTTDVSRYVAGTATNNGWMIRDDVEGSSTTQQTTYAATDANTNTTAPQLDISYTLV
jgi:hypothetical protein